MSNIKVFVFDVDGVIIDSTEECLIIAWNAYQNFCNKQNYIMHPDQANADYIKHFKSIRNYVRSMDEYMIVFRTSLGEITNQQTYEIKLNILNVEERERFGIYFFESRKEFKANDKNAWFSLHTIYPGIEQIIREINNTLSTYIVTGKDKNSVLDFFSLLNVDIASDKIFDKNAAKNKLTALEKIYQIEKVNREEICFLDDNVTHLISPSEKGYRVLLADWGYGMPEHFSLAKSKNIKIISLESLLHTI